MHRTVLGFALALAAGLLVACGGGGDGRVVQITADDSGCTPTSLQARAGEKLTFELKNNARGDRELEGIEGTRFEEILIPAGRSRKANYSVPKSAGVQKLKCYIPGGPSTIIELQIAPA